MTAKRYIVVDGTRYWWVMSTEDTIRIVVRAADGGGCTMATHFAHGNLVTPWLVSEAIRHALANGWTPSAPGPQQTFSFAGMLPDRRVAVPEPAAREVTEDELLDRIAESREDDNDARLVYADWLLERGDERGDLIILACAQAMRALAPDEAARLAALEAIRDTWLGPLLDVVRVHGWARGVLDSVQLGKRAPGAVDRTLGHRAWGTVRTVDCFGQFLAVPDLVRLVTQPALRSLARLTIDSRVARALAGSDAGAFRHLAELAITHPGGPDTVDTIAALGEMMPALRSLAITLHTPDDLAAILAETHASRLVLQDSRFTQLAAWLPGLESRGRHVEEIRFGAWWRGHTYEGPSVAVRRGPDDRWSAFSVEWQGADWTYAGPTMFATLAGLPADGMTSFAIRVLPSREGSVLDDPQFIRAITEAVRHQRGFESFDLRTPRS